MIPTLVDIAAPWLVLPPGIHAATLQEIRVAFATNEVRRALFNGFILGATALAYARCRLVYLDGSFVTSKPIPGDFDACWDPAGVDPTKLDAVFFDMKNKREAQRLKFKGEFLPINRNATYTFVDFFQCEKTNGGTKGLLSVDLTGLHATTEPNHDYQ